MQPKRVWGGLVLLALLDPDDLDEILDTGGNCVMDNKTTGAEA
jgi:hypothetical protein